MTKRSLDPTDHSSREKKLPGRSASVGGLSVRSSLVLLGGLGGLGSLGVLGVVRERLQRAHMFDPSSYPRGSWNPDRHGVEAEDRWFQSADGVTLHGWWIEHPRARGTILYCHGNQGSLGSQIRILRRLRRLRCNLFAFDYRGYGRSEGAPHEAGLYRDVRAAYRDVTEGLGIPPDELILFGHSLGGAVAIDAAVDLDVSGLIVQNSLTQMRDMAKVSLPTLLSGSRLPVAKLPLHWAARNQFRSLEKIDQVGCPTLFVHGRLDQRIPIDQGRKLYERAADPKEFLEIPGAGHDDILNQGRLRYWLGVSRFRDRCLQLRESDPLQESGGATESRRTESTA